MKRMHAAPMVALLVALLAACRPSGPTVSPATTMAATVAPAPTPVALAPTTMPQPAPLLTAEPTATPGPEQNELLAAADAIGAEMQAIRGLDATQPITNSLMSHSELAVYVQDEIDREYTPQEVENDTRAMAAFDFVPEDYDLRAELVELYSSQVAGLYDDERNTLYLVGEGGLDILARATLAHEITHGLQDERFNLNTFLDEDLMSDDEILARQALVEGDATLAMTAYLMSHLSEITDEDLAALQSEEILESEQQLADAPAIIRETFEFPYTYGEAFVSEIQKQGWDAVDAAYSDPPVTTEQILHPEKYLARDEPRLPALPPLTGTLGSGWRLADDGTLGEFQMQVYLAQHLEREIANMAGAGWDGDHYVVYLNGDDELLVLSTAWDSLADRDEFVAAYTDYARAKYGQPGTRDGDAILWETPDQNAYLGWKGDGVLIILTPNRVTVDKILAAVESL